MLNFVKSGNRFLLSLTMLINSVFGYSPLCSFNRVTFDLECMMKRNTLSAWLAISDKPILTSKSAKIKFLGVPFARVVSMGHVRFRCFLL